MARLQIGGDGHQILRVAERKSVELFSEVAALTVKRNWTL
jgi:hypothetical protein